MKSRNTIILLLILLWFAEPPQRVAAQTIHQFTQFYFNPSLLNPSFTGSDGRPALFLSYKKQWAGIDGSPSIANVNLQAPLPNRINVGLNIGNDKSGLLSSTSVLFTGGYTLPAGENQFFRFGLSIGASSSKVDMAALYFGPSANDPVLTNLANPGFQIIGNAGVSFHSHTFHVGASIPNLLQPDYLNKDVFTISEVKPFESLVFHASNRFYFAKGKNVFEPYVIYRFNSSLPSQLEVAGVLHLQNKVYLGASYKQDFGISALAGFKVNKQMAVGYSYTMKNTGINELNKPSHEIHLGILFGKHNKDIPTYSFVDTEKEKVHKKTAAQLAAEKKKHDAELAAKKKQEEELAKKKREEAEKKQQELAAKKAEEEKKKQVAATKTESPVEKPKQIVTEQKTQGQVAIAATATTTLPKKEPIHNGGTRIVHSDSPILIDQLSKEDSIYLEEQAHLNRLEEHAEDPTATHNETHHPNAERHEFVKRGEHHEEMEYGDYVIAGVFTVRENAKKFSDGLIQLGFADSDFGFLTQNKLWYVHIAESNDIKTARAYRDKFRQMKIFRESWLLTVHK